MTNDLRTRYGVVRSATELGRMVRAHRKDRSLNLETVSAIGGFSMRFLSEFDTRQGHSGARKGDGGACCPRSGIGRRTAANEATAGGVRRYIQQRGTGHRGGGVTSIDALDVWYRRTGSSAQSVGRLHRDDAGRIGFEYSRRWIRDGFAVSCSLPLADAPFRASRWRGASFLRQPVARGRGARTNRSHLANPEHRFRSSSCHWRRVRRCARAYAVGVAAGRERGQRVPPYSR